MATISEEELAEYLAMKKARELGIITTEEDHFPGIPANRYRKPWEGVNVSVPLMSTHHRGHLHELQSYTDLALAPCHAVHNPVASTLPKSNSHHNTLHEINTHTSGAKYLHEARKLSKKAMRGV